MLSWFLENLATILVSALLLVAVFFIIRGMVRRKGNTCSCGCSDCQFRGKCH